MLLVALVLFVLVLGIRCTVQVSFPLPAIVTSRRAAMPRESGWRRMLGARQ